MIFIRHRILRDEHGVSRAPSAARAISQNVVLNVPL